jgi:hypothetical protein
VRVPRCVVRARVCVCATRSRRGPGAMWGGGGARRARSAARWSLSSPSTLLPCLLARADTSSGCSQRRESPVCSPLGTHVSLMPYDKGRAAWSFGFGVHVSQATLSCEVSARPHSAPRHLLVICLRDRTRRRVDAACGDVMLLPLESCPQKKIVRSCEGSRNIWCLRLRSTRSNGPTLNIGRVCGS